MTVTTPLNLENVQGDILIALPKKAENYFFFQIDTTHVPQFRADLAKLLPLITTTAECGEHRNQIMGEKQKAAKENRAPALVQVTGINVAFSQKGLNTLGITDNIGDTPFKNGMLANAGAKGLGDDLNKWDPKFKQDIHGVFLITADSVQRAGETLEKVKGLFSVGHPEATIKEVIELNGQTRPGNEDGHEHFGFLDCISQPAIDGVTTFNNPGQETIPQGVILLGREGDDGVQSPAGVLPPGGTIPTPITRPAWAVDGSFLAFRYLQQLVPEFNDFLAQNALKVPIPIAPGDPNGADLLGARLMGRWKSGAPVDLNPIRDNPAQGPDPSRNNNFIYDPKLQVRCPFAAHTRKTNPRSDLFSLGIPTEPRRILRRGIQFGPEVTPAEAQAKKSSGDEKLERGLLFVSYQSNIANGFEFIQQSWANSPTFPPLKTEPVPAAQKVLGAPISPGVDAIIGQASPRSLVGTDPTVDTTSLAINEEFVVPKGGEYFFSPSISALKTKFAAQAAAPHKEL